jgi:hypothetical protein
VEAARLRVVGSSIDVEDEEELEAEEEDWTRRPFGL